MEFTRFLPSLSLSLSLSLPVCWSTPPKLHHVPLCISLSLTFNKPLFIPMCPAMDSYLLDTRILVVFWCQCVPVSLTDTMRRSEEAKRIVEISLLFHTKV
jgi:hypothetical protein